MALYVEVSCLTLNKVLVLLLFSSCANSALLPWFKTGSLEAALSPAPLGGTVRLLLLPGGFMTMELLRVLDFGLDLA